MRRRQIIAGAGFALVGSLAGCTGDTGDVASETFEESFDPADVGSLRVSNDIGDVTVRARDVDAVEVRVRKQSTNGQAGLDDIDVSTAVDGETLTVRTRIDRNANWFSRSSPTTNAVVTVPSAGGPSVTEVNSRLGNVSLLDVRGDTEVGTELGNVTARGVDGYPTLESELGNVVAEGTTGLGGARTELGQVDAELLDVRDDVEVRTELGGVLLDVATDLAVDVVVESNGRISSDLDLTDVRRQGDRLTGLLNGGGSQLRVASELGDVSLRPTEPA